MNHEKKNCYTRLSLGLCKRFYLFVVKRVLSAVFLCPIHLLQQMSIGRRHVFRCMRRQLTARLRNATPITDVYLKPTCMHCSFVVISYHQYLTHKITYLIRTLTYIFDNKKRAIICKSHLQINFAE